MRRQIVILVGSSQLHHTVTWVVTYPKTLKCQGVIAVGHTILTEALLSHLFMFKAAEYFTLCLLLSQYVWCDQHTSWLIHVKQKCKKGKF